MVSGAMARMAEYDAGDLTGVAIAPDLGERYLDAVYQSNWVQALYGDDVHLAQDDRGLPVGLTGATDDHWPSRIPTVQGKTG